MGKVRAEKRYRNRHNPLNSNGKRCINTEEIYYAPNQVAGGPSFPSTSSGKEKAPIVIGKLASSDSADKEYACRCVADFVFTSKYLKHLLKCGVVTHLCSLFIDDNLSIREVATGAFRNLSLAVMKEGENLKVVTEEVLIMLSVLIRECYRNVRLGTEDKEQVIWRSIAVQAMHVLWNLVELSTLTIAAVIREQLVPVILHFAQCGIDVDIAIPAAQCLLSLTEDNAELCHCICRNPELIECLVSSVRASYKSSSGGLIVQAAIAGTLANIAPAMSPDKLPDIVNLVLGRLSEILDVDMPSLFAPHHKDSSPLAPTSKENTSPAISSEACGEIRNVLSAQSLALEVLANTTCIEDDDEWEDIMEEECEAIAMTTKSPENNLELAVLDSIVKHDVHVKAWTKCQFVPSQIQELLLPYPNLHQKVLNVQCTALLCLQNLLTFLDTPNWGGAHKLEEMFTSLFISLNQKNQNSEVLECILKLLRVVVSKLRDVGGRTLNQDHLEVFCQLVSSPPTLPVCLCAIQVLGALCQQSLSPSSHQIIAITFKDVLMKCDNELIVSEVLDSIFGFNDSSLPVIPSSGLLDVMCSLSISLQEKQGPDISAETAVIDVARTNLPRFIDYVRTQCCMTTNSN